MKQYKIYYGNANYAFIDATDILQAIATALEFGIKLREITKIESTLNN